MDTKKNGKSGLSGTLPVVKGKSVPRTARKPSRKAVHHPRPSAASSVNSITFVPKGKFAKIFLMLEARLRDANRTGKPLQRTHTLRFALLAAQGDYPTPDAMKQVLEDGERRGRRPGNIKKKT